MEREDNKNINGGTDDIPSTLAEGKSDGNDASFPLSEVAEEIVPDSSAAFETDELNESLVEVSDSEIIKSERDFDSDMWTDETNNQKPCGKILRQVFDIVEMLSVVTIVIVLCFSFIFRLNIVDGDSMLNTLHTGEYLLVSDLFYEATPGDIVVIHDKTAGHYTNPLVKRVIAVGGQTVDIDFQTGAVRVDGELINESGYAFYDRLPMYASYLSFPMTIEEGKIFVMGDNRNHSADSRLPEIGQIDERCVVGKVYFRVSPLDKITQFKNPYND